jgi:xanthine dehydrogenase YagS FAD-binding subunit
MKPFAFARPASPAEALALLSADARPKGGGYDLLDLAARGVSCPGTMVDLGGLSALTDFRAGKPEGIVLGARLTLSQAAQVLDLRPPVDAPVAVDAILAAATPLVRNRATLGGNLLQRPRCAYFRDPFFDCRKRGGKTCPSVEGEHGEGAVFGNRTCCAVHPSNLAVALLALDAEGEVLSAGEMGEVARRTVKFADGFFIPPEEDPLREARLAPGEILASVAFRPCSASAYEEVNHKQSFDWASASAAAALRLEGGRVAEARLALGFVAPVPVPAPEAAAALVGKFPDAKAAEAAAELAVRGATPLRDNGHKVAHLRVVVKRAILRAAERGRK